MPVWTLELRAGCCFDANCQLWARVPALPRRTESRLHCFAQACNVGANCPWNYHQRSSIIHSRTPAQPTTSKGLLSMTQLLEGCCYLGATVQSYLTHKTPSSPKEQCATGVHISALVFHHRQADQQVPPRPTAALSETNDLVFLPPAAVRTSCNLNIPRLKRPSHAPNGRPIKNYSRPLDQSNRTEFNRQLRRRPRNLLCALSPLLRVRTGRDISAASCPVHVVVRTSATKSVPESPVHRFKSRGPTRQIAVLPPQEPPDRFPSPLPHSRPGCLVLVICHGERKFLKCHPKVRWWRRVAGYRRPVDSAAHWRRPPRQHIC